MNNMRYLMIDRILSKDVLIRQGQRINDILKNTIASRSQITDIQIDKIDKLVRTSERTMSLGWCLYTLPSKTSLPSRLTWSLVMTI